jgi:hypothetical protein
MSNILIQNELQQRLSIIEKKDETNCTVQAIYLAKHECAVRPDIAHAIVCQFFVPCLFTICVSASSSWNEN